MAATVTVVLAGRSMKFLKPDWLKIVSSPPSTLETILSMCFAQGRKSPSGAMYCYPKQSWLGDQSGRCRKTINELIDFLRGIGAIVTQYRSKVNGHFRTLLYKVGPLILKAIACANSAYTKASYRVTQKLHISNKETIFSDKSCENKVSNPHSLAPPAEPAFITDFRMRRSDLFGAGIS